MRQDNFHWCKLPFCNFPSTQWFVWGSDIAVKPFICFNFSFQGVFSGLLAQRFGRRKIAFLGAILMFASMCASSFVKTLPLLYFTYGILPGEVRCLIIKKAFWYFKVLIQYSLVNLGLAFKSSSINILLLDHLTPYRHRVMCFLSYGNTLYLWIYTCVQWAIDVVLLGIP